jgi:predicted nucleic acid-binding protein
MIVVADTTPLRYLVFIEEEQVLGLIFGKVYVPPEVLRVELQGRKTPDIVRRWAQSPPAWLIEQAPTHIDSTLPTRLHKGEIEAISLAQELKADLLLVDDWDARKAARERKFKLAGTLAILEEAAVRGFLDIDQAVNKLELTNYYASEEQYQATIDNVRVRKQAQEQDPLKGGR